YVKPHGALYNLAAKDDRMARVVAATVKEFDADLWLMGLAGSAGLKIAAETGLKTVAEAFGDRRYDDQGGLLSRALPNAVIESADETIEQVLNLVQRGQVRSASGQMVPMAAESICLHGDNPAALMLARRLRAALVAAEIEVKPFIHRT
ncbi:LamB/YcsF family protein, partial [Opitutaceae bacterium]|nr:LamB/YcsF family protein [Opitutaceae bacterium]